MRTHNGHDTHQRATVGIPGAWSLGQSRIRGASVAPWCGDMFAADGGGWRLIASCVEDVGDGGVNVDHDGGEPGNWSASGVGSWPPVLESKNRFRYSCISPTRLACQTDICIL